MRDGCSTKICGLGVDAARPAVDRASEAFVLCERTDGDLEASLLDEASAEDSECCASLSAASWPVPGLPASVEALSLACCFFLRPFAAEASLCVEKIVLYMSEKDSYSDLWSISVAFGLVSALEIGLSKSLPKPLFLWEAFFARESAA